MGLDVSKIIWVITQTCGLDVGRFIVENAFS
jgi:hypothetical protein